MFSLLKVQEGDSSYAFYTHDVREVTLCPTLQPSGRSEQAVVEGYFRLGKRWVPVIPLYKLLQSPPREIALYDALLVAQEQNPWALRVGRVVGFQRCSWEDLKPVPGSQNTYPGLAAHIDDENGQIPVLVLPQLLLESERLAMERQTQLIEERKQKAEAELALLDEAHGE